MLSFSLGMAIMDRVRNEYNGGTTHVERFGDKVRETRLGWFGHVQRTCSGHAGQMILNIEQPDKSGRPQRRSMDAVNLDMQRVGATEVGDRDKPRCR